LLGELDPKPPVVLRHDRTVACAESV
jgi:hypothetical protein